MISEKIFYILVVIFFAIGYFLYITIVTIENDEDLRTKRKYIISYIFALGVVVGLILSILIVKSDIAYLWLK